MLMLRGLALRRWRRVLTAVVAVPMAGTVAALLIGLRHGIVSRHLWLFVAFYGVTALGVTAGYHRLFAHHSFSTSPLVRVLLGIAGSMAVQGPILGWVADHRLHHKHSDGAGDPHSPAFGRGSTVTDLLPGLLHAQCGWFFKGWRATGRLVRDLYRDKSVRFVDRHYPSWIALSLVLPGAIDCSSRVMQEVPAWPCSWQDSRASSCCST